MNIYLCGFMGCGKTTIGKLLATKLDYSFIDLDEYITNKTGKSIPEIFKKQGEKHFRALEASSLAELTDNNLVISTGGGALVSISNAIKAKNHGRIVFINTSFNICYDRVVGDQNRPIAKSKSKSELYELFKKRLPYYITHCDYEVDGNEDPEDIVSDIKKFLQTK